uniref:Uncharacterized protein n=1 Tax=Oryza sativa subsp. japonica TaxID=39947 RepID=Q2QQ86_ORYSJ|nr:hypothetical protein LOC_Os12g31870 [Oryza sativa Japonica Group]
MGAHRVARRKEATGGGLLGVAQQRRSGGVPRAGIGGRLPEGPGEQGGKVRVGKGVAARRETPAGVDNGDETHRDARGDELGGSRRRGNGGRGAVERGDAFGGSSMAERDLAPRREAVGCSGGGDGGLHCATKAVFRWWNGEKEVCSSAWRSLWKRWRGGRLSAQQSAFAVGVLSDLNAFHRSTGNSLCPYRTPAW